MAERERLGEADAVDALVEAFAATLPLVAQSEVRDDALHHSMAAVVRQLAEVGIFLERNTARLDVPPQAD
jgi:hypothetical protein